MSHIPWKILPVDTMKGLTIGKEWGAGYTGKGHCHAVLTTTDKMKIEDVKKILREDYKIAPHDIQSVKNLEREKASDTWDGYEHRKWQKQAETLIPCSKRLPNRTDLQQDRTHGKA